MSETQITMRIKRLEDRLARIEKTAAALCHVEHETRNLLLWLAKREDVYGLLPDYKDEYFKGIMSGEKDV